METKKLICINCPLGCNLEVSINAENGEYKVTGNTCKRGVDYAISELTNPTRIVTTSLFVLDGKYPTVPVKTSGEIPKNIIMPSMKYLANIKVNAPIKTGDVLVKNILDTGVDIVATRTVDKE